jgi:hypothetical protein
MFLISIIFLTVFISSFGLKLLKCKKRRHITELGAKADETHRIFAYFYHCVKFYASKIHSHSAVLHSLFCLINLCKINCTNFLSLCVCEVLLCFFSSYSSPTIVKLFISLRSSSLLYIFLQLSV